MKTFLSFASKLADAARGLILELWTNDDFGTQLKSDLSPVTRVDTEAELLIRKMILATYPSHGIIGEEFDELNVDSEFQWTVDPIDGTQNLVNRIPTFGSLIGLRYQGKAVLGVIDHPLLNLRTIGAVGCGVESNGRTVRMSDLTSAAFSPNDLIATNNPAVWERDDETSTFDRVMATHPHSRIYYDCYAHTLAVHGSLAVVVEPNMKIWDITPAEILVPEAGGKFEYFGTPSKGRYNAVFGKCRAVDLVRSRAEI